MVFVELCPGSADKNLCLRGVGCNVLTAPEPTMALMCHGDNGNRGGFDRWPDLNFERRPQLFKRGWERWELSIERIPASKPAQLQTFRLEPHSKEENWWSSWCFFDVPSWFWRDLSSCLKQSAEYLHQVMELQWIPTTIVTHQKID